MTLTQKEDRARSILRAIQSGHRRTQIADDHAVSESVVKAVACGGSFPHIYEEIMGKKPRKKARTTRATTPDDVIMRCHEMAKGGLDVKFIAASVGMTIGATRAYLLGQNRLDLYERFHNSFGAKLITRPWGRSTKPGGPPVVLNEAA